MALAGCMLQQTLVLLYLGCACCKGHISLCCELCPQWMLLESYAARCGFKAASVFPGMVHLSQGHQQEDLLGLSH